MCYSLLESFGTQFQERKHMSSFQGLNTQKSDEPCLPRSGEFWRRLGQHAVYRALENSGERWRDGFGRRGRSGMGEGSSGFCPANVLLTEIWRILETVGVTCLGRRRAVYRNLANSGDGWRGVLGRRGRRAAVHCDRCCARRGLRAAIRCGAAGGGHGVLAWRAWY